MDDPYCSRPLDLNLQKVPRSLEPDEPKALDKLDASRAYFGEPANSCDCLTTFLGRGPSKVRCPFCNQNVTTAAYKVPTFCGYCWGAFLCMLGCFCGCCMAPLMLCTQIVHQCPFCENTIGHYDKRSSRVEEKCMPDVDPTYRLQFTISRTKLLHLNIPILAVRNPKDDEVIL